MQMPLVLIYPKEKQREVGGLIDIVSEGMEKETSSTFQDEGAARFVVQFLISFGMFRINVFISVLASK